MYNLLAAEWDVKDNLVVVFDGRDEERTIAPWIRAWAWTRCRDREITTIDDDGDDAAMRLLSALVGDIELQGLLYAIAEGDVDKQVVWQVGARTAVEVRRLVDK